MKNIILAAAVILAVAAGSGYAYKAAADSPAAGPDGASGPPGPPGPPGPWAGGFGPGPGGPGGPPPWRKRGDKHSNFSLFAGVQNKNLSAADVKTIANAILLEHGNHNWTVTNIAAQTDKSIDFSYATQHGDIVASFALDPATGHIKRIS